MDDEFINPATLSNLCGVSVPGLAQLRYRGLGPTFYKPTPKTVLYKMSEALQWIESSAQTRTGTRSPAY